MSEFISVAKVGEIPAGEGKTVEANGKMIAVLREDDSYYAIDDACPHMGASLGAGYVENGAVICPWHAWRFSVVDGSWLDSPKSKLKCGSYQIRVEGDDIQVCLTPADPECQP
ncbi:Rieske (2Fe-2S) protein [Planctomicrobium sp. SH527]|uniref:Rieske (2Fe-2S) protein n=1 Tax=Planctomicrobium sp. SH527 TaxID=3448123 RepID=UPI003F5CA161